MLVKEYRICMPLTVEEYNIGQLYTISRHSLEASGAGEGVQILSNVPQLHPLHGMGRFTEKRIHLGSKVPQWARMFVPQMLYVTEKAWNWYPYTETEYSCSFLPRFSIRIQTRFENNAGTNDQVFEDACPKDAICKLDIVFDDIPERYYKSSEDLRQFRSVKTGRGPFTEGWRETQMPIMCSYKMVAVSFEVYGFQTRVEQWVHKNIRDILLIGHRQAFAWIDEWIGMSIDDVRDFEKKLMKETNVKIMTPEISGQDSLPSTGGSPRPILARSTSVQESRPTDPGETDIQGRLRTKERSLSGQ